MIFLKILMKKTLKTFKLSIVSIVYLVKNKGIESGTEDPRKILRNDREIRDPECINGRYCVSIRYIQKDPLSVRF